MDIVSTGPVTSSKKRDVKAGQRLRNRRRLKQNIPLLAMFIPILVYYIVFKYLPMFGYTMAFQQYNFNGGIFHSPWVGFDNFKLLFSIPTTVNIIRNTFMLSVLNIIFGFPAPIILALMLNEIRNVWFKKSVQTIVYLPHFFSWVIIGGMVYNLFSMETGIINKWVEVLFGEAYPFLYNGGWWIAIFIVSGIWREAGFGTIIYLSALSSIDPNLYEAAVLDGANKLQQIRYITIPSIMPTIITLFVLQVGHVMEVGFDQAFMLQNSVVMDVADVISTYNYRVGIQGGQFSITTAMGLFESLIGLVLVLITNKIANRFDEGLW